MNNREQFDRIADSIRNGQREQAFRQMWELGPENLPEMMDYFVADLSDSGLAVDSAKTYIRNLPASIQEAEETRRGALAAEVLALKQKRNGRYLTTWGDKTPLGLYRTLARIVTEGA